MKDAVIGTNTVYIPITKTDGPTYRWDPDTTPIYDEQLADNYIRVIARPDLDGLVIDQRGPVVEIVGGEYDHPGTLAMTVTSTYIVSNRGQAEMERAFFGRADGEE